MAKTIIFPAQRIITMYPEQPYATAVAVKDGRILAVGEPDEVIDSLKNSPFGPYEIDTTFQDKVLIPGLVDAHTHLEVQALIYSGHFVAQIPWPRPEGGFYPIYPTKEDVLNRLKELDAELPPGELLYAVAYDENKIGAFLNIDELDGVSTTRPILVSNLVFHRFWANSFLLESAGIDPQNPPDGIETDNNGRLTGTLLEATGLSHLLHKIPDLVNIAPEKVRRILPLFTAGGNTTVTDAAFGLLGLENSWSVFTELLSDPDTGLRVIGLPWAPFGVPAAGGFENFIQQVEKTGRKSSEKLRIGPIKLYTDGSIISRTSPIGWPGYWDGTTEPKMAHAPETVTDLLIQCHERGYSTVTHANSGLGCQVVLDAVAEAQSRCYRPDMRHRIDHCYGITEAQLHKAKALGVAIQFFSTQIYYYGESHLALQGLSRAHHITPIGTAKRLGVSWGFHNDPPGTPQLPWVGAWTVVQRQTRETNTVLGPGHKVSVEDALRAMTIEAAYQLHLDHEIGSIVFGKKADFCVLEADPLMIDPLELKDIPVWGTVFGGLPQPSKK